MKARHPCRTDEGYEILASGPLAGQLRFWNLVFNEAMIERVLPVAGRSQVRAGW